MPERLPGNLANDLVFTGNDNIINLDDLEGESLASDPSDDEEGNGKEADEVGEADGGGDREDKLLKIAKLMSKSDDAAKNQFGAAMTLCESLVKQLQQERVGGGKRKGDDEKVKEEEFVLVEKTGLSYRDDQNQTLDWPIRRMVKPIASDPEEWWKPTADNKETYPRITKPILGSNWYLDHVMTQEVAPSTILAASDSGTYLEIEKFLSRNSACMRQASKKFRVVVSEDDTALDFAKTWEQPEKIYEAIEGILNWCAIEQVLRPHSYAGIAVLRAFHEVR